MMTNAPKISDKLTYAKLIVQNVNNIAINLR